MKNCRPSNSFDFGPAKGVVMEDSLPATTSGRLDVVRVFLRRDCSILNSCSFCVCSRSAESLSSMNSEIERASVHRLSVLNALNLGNRSVIPIRNLSEDSTDAALHSSTTESDGLMYWSGRSYCL